LDIPGGIKIASVYPGFCQPDSRGNYALRKQAGSACRQGGDEAPDIYRDKICCLPAYSDGLLRAFF